MAFVNGQTYTSSTGVTGTWSSQTGCFHVVVDEVSTKFTAAEFGLEDQVAVTEEVVTTTEE